MSAANERCGAEGPGSAGGRARVLIPAPGAPLCLGPGASPFPGLGFTIRGVGEALPGWFASVVDTGTGMEGWMPPEVFLPPWPAFHSLPDPHRPWVSARFPLGSDARGDNCC